MAKVYRCSIGRLVPLIVALCVICRQVGASASSSAHPEDRETNYLNVRSAVPHHADSDKTTWEKKYGYLFVPGESSDSTTPYKNGPGGVQEEHPQPYQPKHYRPDHKPEYFGQDNHYHRPDDKPGHWGDYKPHKDDYHPGYKDGFKPDDGPHYALDHPDYLEMHRHKYTLDVKSDHNHNGKPQERPYYTTDQGGVPEEYRPYDKPHYKPIGDHSPHPEGPHHGQDKNRYMTPQPYYGQDKDSHHEQREGLQYGEDQGYEEVDSSTGITDNNSHKREDNTARQNSGLEKEEEPSYGGQETLVEHHICLHEDTRMDNGVAAHLAQEFKSTFGCCTHDDRPGFCLSSKGGRAYYSSDDFILNLEKNKDLDNDGFRSESPQDAYNTQETAAVCSWTYDRIIDNCPTHLVHACWGSGTLTCTLATAACDGGFHENKLQFIAYGYFIGLEALSCDELYGQAMDPGVVTSMARGRSYTSTPKTIQGLFAGMAWLFKGDIHTISTGDGRDATGFVQFVPSFENIFELDDTEAGAVPAHNTDESSSLASLALGGKLLSQKAATNVHVAASEKNVHVNAASQEATKPQAASTRPDPADGAPEGTPIHPAATVAARAKPLQHVQRAPFSQHPATPTKPQKQAMSAIPYAWARLTGAGQSRSHAHSSHTSMLGDLSLSRFISDDAVPLTPLVVKGGSLKVALFERRFE